MSSINGLRNMEATLGSACETLAKMGPKDAGKYWDDNHSHYGNVMRANFNVERMPDDKLAGLMMQAFERIWTNLPERPGTMEEQARIVRVLYIAASHMQAVQRILSIAGIKNTNQYADPIVFRDRTAAERGKPNSDEHGPVFPFAMHAACSALKTTANMIDARAYAKQLRLMQMKVGCDARPKHGMRIEGFFAGEVQQHSTATKPVIVRPAFAGKDDTQINLTGLGIDEFRLKAMGWEDMGFSMPMAIIKELLCTYGDRAISVADIGAEVPRKS